MAENANKPKTSYWKGLKAEFKKIVWPAKRDVAKQTALIIVVTIILGVIIKFLDTGIQALLNVIR
ncbi:MAG: preprotein translocase subunit SecE [Parasporobacterium sp.]|nr:preprotein translocase subunit SecE [Parasporobacterium sp.]